MLQYTTNIQNSGCSDSCPMSAFDAVDLFHSNSMAGLFPGTTQNKTGVIA